MENTLTKTFTEENFLKDVEDITNSCLNVNQEIRLLSLLQTVKDSQNGNYDKLKEDNGLMEIELRHTKTLLSSCEKALESRNEDNKILLEMLKELDNAYDAYATDLGITSGLMNKVYETIKKAESK